MLISAGRTTRAARYGRSTTTWSGCAELDKPHEVYRYDAGHGSLVVEERIKQLRLELAFAEKHLGGS